MNYKCDKIILRIVGDLMEKYVPDLYQKNIYEINYKNLTSRGIKLLIFDLDNTIALLLERHANEDAKKLFDKLKKKFKILIASNSIKARVKVFANDLGVDYISNCRKPKARELEQYILNSGYKLSEIAIIGDSMMDDVVCGNRIGITTILTDQLGRKEFITAYFKRYKEKKVQKKLRDKNLFTKGRHYE